MRPRQDGVDELNREDREGSESSEVGFESGGVREGEKGRTAAGGEEGVGRAVGMMGTCRLLKVTAIQNTNYEPCARSRSRDCSGARSGVFV